MKKRIVSISQLIIVLFVISLIYEFDKSNSRKSKDALKTIRLLKSYNNLVNESDFHPVIFDSIINNYNRTNNREISDLNYESRIQIVRYLESLGVSLNEIENTKQISTEENNSFTTSYINTIDSLNFTKFDDYGDNSVNEYLANYRFLTSKRKVTVLTGIDSLKLSSIDWSDTDLKRNNSLNFNNKIYFQKCFIQNDSIFLEFTRFNGGQSQGGPINAVKGAPIETSVISDISYAQLIPTISNLRELNDGNREAITKYENESLGTVEHFLSREYLALFNKVDLFGFKLSNQSFSTVILLVLLFLSIALYITANQIQSNSLDLSDSENIFSVFLNVPWLRLIIWIIFPVTINYIALTNSLNSSMYTAGLVAVSIFTTFCTVHSTLKLSK